MDMFFFLQDATSAGGTQGGPQGSPGEFLKMLPMLGMILIVMYFLMIRPQSKMRKERDTMLAGLKKNDHVLTTGGIYGVIKQVKPDDPYLTLCVDERNDVCIRVSKDSIAKLEGEAKAEPKAEPQDNKKS